MKNRQIQLNQNLVRKYEERTIPYYTSYPTGGQWESSFNHQNYVDALSEAARENQKVPLSLYIHFPFCPELCYYCCCVKTITKKRDRVVRYLDYLHREIDMLLGAFEELKIEPDVSNIALGGGTPTYMERHEFDALIEKLGSFVNISKLDEFILEVDPRTVESEDMYHYLDSGISRLSFGIQDFDPEVQKAINRVQPYEMIDRLIAGDLRRCSVNFDLIYGLPCSNRNKFKETLRLVRQLDPDRLSVYNYDHTPEIHKGMRAINSNDLPSLMEKSFIYGDTIDELLNSGYQHIGIDHFAKPDDKLALAYNNGHIWRNLAGYTAYHKDCLEIGLGNSSISALPNYYFQSIKNEEDYYRSIDNREFPILRGYKLNPDDILRRDVIFNLISKHTLDIRMIEDKYDIVFKEYFKEDLNLFDEPIRDDLVEIDDRYLRITPLGKIYSHHVARPFDRYLREGEDYLRTHAAILEEQKLSG